MYIFSVFDLNTGSVFTGQFKTIEDKYIYGIYHERKRIQVIPKIKYENILRSRPMPVSERAIFESMINNNLCTDEGVDKVYNLRSIIWNITL